MAKTSVLTSRVEPGVEERLRRKARQLGRSPSETGALLIDEGLRRDEFAFIDFRDSPVGRQAYLQGSTLAAWEVVWISRGFGGGVRETAAHLGMPPLKVQAALNYAEAFPEEIENALKEQNESNFASLSRALPQAEIFPPKKKR